MAFQTVPIRVIGGTSQNKSPQANSELTKNWYPEITQGGRSPAVLLPWPGSISFGYSSGTKDRGVHVFKELLYQVVDEVLYEVSASGVQTSKGAILGNDRCVFADNGFEMVIACDGGVYSFNGVTLTQGDAVTFENTRTVTMLNNQFVYDDIDNLFFVSDPGDALSVNGLNYASAESAGDDLVRPYSFGQMVYMFGTETVEPWWNSGTGAPPFDRLDRGIIQKGLGGLHTVANTDQFLYFIGDDSNVYQIIETTVQKISTPSISYQLGKLNVANAVAWTMVLDGQDFYIINFNTNNLTYAYSEQTQEWFNLSTGTASGRYIGSSFARVYDKDIIVDYANSNTLQLSDTAYDDNGQTIQRRRVLPPINSSQLGLGAGKRLLMSKAKFILQTGQGLASGQGSEPKVMIEYSLDGGATWSTERWANTGKLGQYLINVEFWEMITFYDIQFRLTISDPVFSSLHDGSLDIKGAGY